jgi:dolichol-phosphate mannosyltransferase
MLSRNFSHQNALIAGLHHARGQAVISMDSDLQHPPESIPALVAAWEQGYQVVTTRRHDVKVATGFKRASSRLFYRFFSFMTGVNVEQGASDFRLLDHLALQTLLRFAGSDRFLRGSIQWMGFSSTIISYEAGARFAGSSKYNLRKMLKFAGTAITSFSNRPLRFSIWLGLTVGLLALAELFYVLLMALSGETVPGWASTLGIISFLFAALFMVLGIMGVYIARIHTLLQNRPQFIVADHYQAERIIGAGGNRNNYSREQIQNADHL